MDKFIAEKTKSTPYIELDDKTHKFVFKGQSYPENAYKLYEPVYNWLDEYFKEVAEDVTVIEFTLSYINTSSTKCLIVLLDKLNKAYTNGKRIVINWYYDEENGFDYEMGQDFKEDIEVPFNFIPQENEE